MSRKTTCIILFSLIFAIGTFAQSRVNTVGRFVDFGYKTVENRKVDAVIVHSTYSVQGGDKYDLVGVIKQLSDYGVSAHYVIGREGTIYQLVNEKNVAYHAGKSQLPDGRTAVNTCSIGIEIITSTDSLDTPSEKQINSLVTLVKDIKHRYRIKYVLRHSDIAPERKTDPWHMDWLAFLKRLED